MKSLLMAAMGSAVLLAAVPVHAAPIAPLVQTNSDVVLVAGGCGANAWRGPYGECRSTPFYGRLPNGYFQPPPHEFFGCPDGYWRGPWGHCRNTPYHGNLPGGGSK